MKIIKVYQDAEHANRPDADVDYFINGNDSHLYIDSEEVYA